MKICRTILLALVFAGGISAAFGQTSVTVDTIAPSITAGSYRGLLTGGTANSGLFGGIMNVQVDRTGLFTATLNLAGVHYPFVGAFNGSALYSGTLNAGTRSEIDVALAVSGSDALSGTVTSGSKTLSYAGGLYSNTSPAGGKYRFIISPSETGSGAPQGTGYGNMNVHSNGTVSFVGTLGDGTPFSTATAIVSGSNAPVYLHLGKSPNTGLSGIITFQQGVPNGSGTINWVEAPNENARYTSGFATATLFQASQFNRVIAGLDKDAVQLGFTGGDLGTSSTSGSVTVQYISGLYNGHANAIHINIESRKNDFYGSFEDPITHMHHEFHGVLLTSTRTGAGLFFAPGDITGTVAIQY